MIHSTECHGIRASSTKDSYALACGAEGYVGSFGQVLKGSDVSEVKVLGCWEDGWKIKYLHFQAATVK